MALPPTRAAGAPPPASAAAPPVPAAGAGAAPGEGPDLGTDEAEGDGEGEVIATICYSKDSGFTLYRGDEPDEDAEAPAGEEGGEPPAPAPGEEELAGGEKEEGEKFSNVGELMRAVLSCVKDAEEGGEGDEFQKGFDDGDDMQGGPAMTPAGTVAGES